MKIKIKDSEYEVKSVNYAGNTLEVAFDNKTAEEVKKIFTNTEDLSEIDVLDDSDKLMSQIIGYNVLSRVELTDLVTAYLIKETTLNEQRITVLEVEHENNEENIDTNTANIDYIAMESGIDL